MPPGPEAKIEDAFVAEMTKRGHLCPKLRWDGRNGWPDRTLITPWGVRFYEFKAPGGQLSRAQTRMHLMLANSDHWAVVVFSLEEAMVDYEAWRDANRGD